MPLISSYIGSTGALTCWIPDLLVGNSIGRFPTNHLGKARAKVEGIEKSSRCRTFDVSETDAVRPEVTFQEDGLVVSPPDARLGSNAGPQIRWIGPEAVQALRNNSYLFVASLSPNGHFRVLEDAVAGP